MSIGRSVSEGPQRRLLQLVHLRLPLLQPELDAHLAEHRRRGGEVLVGPLAIARAPEELAEAEVAAGDEGAHAARLGERQRRAFDAAGPANRDPKLTLPTACETMAPEHPDSSPRSSSVRSPRA